MALTKVTSGVRTLAANEVSTSNIADDAVTGPKIAMGSDAQGDILFRGASNYERLAKGTAGQKLQMNSGATAPEWVDDGYRAGEVIEELWLPQNGTSQTVLSGTYTGANITALQDLSATYTDITGSAINYTPPSGATRVVYSLHLYASFHSTANVYSHYKTFLDSTEVTAARASNGAQYLAKENILTWVFLIGGSADAATGRVATWTSAKQIKMQARMYSGSYAQRLHQTYYWDGAVSGQMRVPIINVKAIK